MGVGGRRENKVWKQNNKDALDGRKGRIKINSGFWLGWFTVRYYYYLREIVFGGRFVCGGVGREGSKEPNFDTSDEKHHLSPFMTA